MATKRPIHVVIRSPNSKKLKYLGNLNNFQCVIDPKMFIDNPLVGPKPPKFHYDRNFLQSVQVVHIESTDKFYIRTKNAEAEIENLEKEMSTFYDKNVGKIRVAPASELNGFYAVKLTGRNNSWRRVYIYNLSNYYSGGVIAYIYEIDHGSKRVCKLEDMYPLCKKFSETTAGVLPARLYKINPDYVWTKEEEADFKEDHEDYTFNLVMMETEPGLEEPYDTLSVVL